MKYNAILIDSTKQIIDEIEIEDNKISEVIGCEYITIGARLENGDILYVDDMGLLKGTTDGFCWKHTLIVGNGVVLGCKNNGDTQDVVSRIGQIEDIVKFTEASNDYLKQTLKQDFKQDLKFWA